MTSNCVESYNSWICEARFLPVVQMIDRIRVQIMDRMNTRRQRVEKWVNVLCCEPQKILNKNMSESVSLHVIMAADNMYEVFDWRTIAVRPTLRSCTCREWNVTRIPCRDACVVIQFIQHSVLNYLDDHMKVETYE